MAQSVATVWKKRILINFHVYEWGVEPLAWFVSIEEIVQYCICKYRYALSITLRT